MDEEQKIQIPETSQENKQEQSQKKGEPITESLKQKFADNTDKQQLFLNIFKDPELNKLYTPNDIINYIKNNDINGFSRILQIKSAEDKQKLILEDMDLYFKNNGGIKEIKTYNNELIEKDKVVSEKDKVVSEKDKVVSETKQQEEATNIQLNWTIQQKDQIIQEKTTETIQKDTKIEQWTTLLEARTATENSYNDLEAKYKPTDNDKDKIEAIKKKISPETRKTLDEGKIDINTYANFIFTKETYRDQLKKDNKTEFLTNLESFEKMLPDRTTMGELTNPEKNDSNKAIQNYAQNSKNLDKITKPTLPEIKDFDKEYDTYVKYIPDEQLKENIIKNKDLIKSYKDKLDASDEESARTLEDEPGKTEYDEYADAIVSVQEQLQTRTQEITKQRVMGSCISWLAKYFDSTRITSAGNKENLGDNFDVNTQEGFTIENDVLAIKGSISGNDIGFYYDLTNPDAQLQSDDFLHFDGASESFAFGAGSGGKNNLGVKLPTVTMLSEQAQQVSEKNFATLLEKSWSTEELETAMKDQVSNELLKNYGQEALVKTRVGRDIEKNITTQTLHSTFFPEVVMTEMNRDKSINKTTEKKARKLLKIFDTTTENMRSDELRDFRELVEKLDPLTSNPPKQLEPKRQELMSEMDGEKWANTYDEQRWKNTLKFFKRFSKDDKINIQDLKVFVDTLEKQEPIAENITKYSPDFQTAQDRQDADKLLENIV